MVVATDAKKIGTCAVHMLLESRFVIPSNLRGMARDEPIKLEPYESECVTCWQVFFVGVHQMESNNLPASCFELPYIRQCSLQLVNQKVAQNDENAASLAT